jgi:DNA-binding NarL/FixJ family response regulator
MHVRDERAMKAAPVHVVLADMTRLTRDLIFRIVEAEPGVEVVAEVPDHAFSLRDVVAETAADVVILGADSPGLLGECIELLDELALRRVLAVSADGRRAHLYGAGLDDTRMDEFTPESLRELVRIDEILETAASTAQGGLQE